MSAAPVIKPQLTYRLKIILGPHQNEIHTLDKDLIKIGRGDDNTIQLPRDSRISRNHIEIARVGTEYKVRNLSQKNFVMVNDKVVQEEFLKPGIKIQIGETLIEVFEDGPILVPNVNEKSAHSTQAIAQVRAAAGLPASSRLQQSPSPAPLQSPQMASRKSNRPAPQHMRPARSNSKTTFYAIFGIVILLIVWLAGRETKPKQALTFRSSQQVEYDRLQIEAEKLKLEERLSAQNNQIMRQAQENMVKGFRDFQQGNYIRAKENFASVLVKDPDNELAKRYYHLSGIKFDELLQFNILQGLRYREKKNYRLCRSSFQSALIMIQNNNRHPKYKEIKNYFDECNLGLEGRF